MEPEKRGLWHKYGNCYIARSSQLECETSRRTRGFERVDSGVDVTYDDYRSDCSDDEAAQDISLKSPPAQHSTGSLERNVSHALPHTCSSVELSELLTGDVDWVSSQPFAEDAEAVSEHAEAVHHARPAAAEPSVQNVVHKRKNKRVSKRRRKKPISPETPLPTAEIDEAISRRQKRRQRKRSKRNKPTAKDQDNPGFAHYEPLLFKKYPGDLSTSLCFFVDVTPAPLNLESLHEKAQSDCRSDVEVLRDTSPASKRCHLFELPVEVRMKIYSFNLTSKDPTHCPKLTTPYAFEDSVPDKPLLIPRPTLGVNILRTCRQIHREASQILYDENHFVAHLGHHQDKAAGEYGHIGITTSSQGTEMYYNYHQKDDRDKIRSQARSGFAHKETLREQEFDLRRALWHFHPNPIARMARLTIWMKIDRQDLGSLKVDWSVLRKTRALRTLGIAISIRDIHSKSRQEYADAFSSTASRLYEEYGRARWIEWQIGGDWSNETNGIPWQRIFSQIPAACSLNLAPFSRESRQELASVSPGSVFISWEDLNQVTERWRGVRGWAWKPESLELDAPQDENLKCWMSRYVGRCSDCRHAKGQHWSHGDEDDEEIEGDSGSSGIAIANWLEELRAVRTMADLKSKYELLASFSRGEARPSNVGDDVLLQMNRALVLRQKELKVAEWSREIDSLWTMAEARAHRQILLDYSRSGRWPYMMDQRTWRDLLRRITERCRALEAAASSTVVCKEAEHGKCFGVGDGGIMLDSWFIAEVEELA